MSYEQICPRCRRVCFSREEFETHECFDMDDKLDAEIALANWDSKLPRGHQCICVDLKEPKEIPPSCEFIRCDVLQLRAFGNRIGVPAQLIGALSFCWKQAKHQV